MSASRTAITTMILIAIPSFASAQSTPPTGTSDTPASVSSGPTSSSTAPVNLQILDAERLPTEHRVLTVRIPTHSRENAGGGPNMRLLGMGTVTLIAAQLFPFAVAAANGDFTYALPIVPEIIGGVRILNPPPPAAPGAFANWAAAISFLDAAIQLIGLSMSVAGSILRQPPPGQPEMELVRRRPEWFLVPFASHTQFGLNVALVGW